MYVNATLAAVLEAGSMQTHSFEEQARLLSKLAFASAAAFLVLFSVSLGSGVSQQWFEHVRVPEAYAAALREGAFILRALITLDDVFIALYVSTALLFARTLSRSDALLACCAGAAALTAGVLDYAENHHILAMLGAAELGLNPSLAELVQRESWSALKWMLAHFGFFLAGLAIRPRTPLVRIFRISLLAFQLPIGALAWTVPSPSWVVPIAIARAAGLFGGFVLIALLARDLARDDAPARDAPV
jgi:hypothetical protein